MFYNLRKGTREIQISRNTFQPPEYLICLHQVNSSRLVVKQREDPSSDELHSLKPNYSLTVSLAVSAVGCQSTGNSRILSKICEPQWSSRPAEARHEIPAAGVLP